MHIKILESVLQGYTDEQLDCYQRVLCDMVLEVYDGSFVHEFDFCSTECYRVETDCEEVLESLDLKSFRSCARFVARQEKKQRPKKYR